MFADEDLQRAVIDDSCALWRGNYRFVSLLNPT